MKGSLEYSGSHVVLCVRRYSQRRLLISFDGVLIARAGTRS